LWIELLHHPSIAWNRSVLHHGGRRRLPTLSRFTDPWAGTGWTPRQQTVHQAAALLPPTDRIGLRTVAAECARAPGIRCVFSFHLRRPCKENGWIARPAPSLVVISASWWVHAHGTADSRALVGSRSPSHSHYSSSVMMMTATTTPSQCTRTRLLLPPGTRRRSRRRASSVRTCPAGGGSAVQASEIELFHDRVWRRNVPRKMTCKVGVTAIDRQINSLPISYWTTDLYITAYQSVLVLVMGDDEIVLDGSLLYSM
jgi:hypothetical protein